VLLGAVLFAKEPAARFLNGRLGELIRRRFCCAVCLQRDVVVIPVYFGENERLFRLMPNTDFG
jgi:hypothetical protein